ncbi:tetratricopeptide repeat protein [Ramlibacter terrae]|uniref:Tetratricopeptide repeat protein n=1 Tax=Ramlibacter terrae TaxID=2732511 RepID=A0ABX6P6S9_9BURK|nr:tetratricopeptide repeat protein [Ramlibacter terrae]
MRARAERFSCGGRPLQDPHGAPSAGRRRRAGWAESSFQLGAFEDALTGFGRAIQLAPELARLRVLRGDALQAVGRLPDAAADYQAALKLAPNDDATLKKATLCMLEAGQGEQAIALCREILKVRPDSLTAKLGAEWVMSQLVPLWHVPMMNEPERNRAFHDGWRRP